MANDKEKRTSRSGEDIMLREALDALDKGDRVRARDLLTRLLKADQNNPNYWVWMSAAVDTTKESLYCLQTAIKLDPKNPAAKRGLVILGGLPPDENVKPFKLPRSRAWEEDISIPTETSDRPAGLAASIKGLLKILGLALIIAGIFVVGYFLFAPGGIRLTILSTPTHRPTLTISPTPTLTPIYRTATPTFLGPTPLSYFLASTYTPTPLYVITEHPALTSSLFDAGLRLLADKDYEIARVQFQQVLQSEPEATDALYYIGESYRFEGNFVKAREAYQEAINTNQAFAPAFLGRAISNLALDRDADVEDDLNNALILDPQFVEAYIQRAAFLSSRGRYPAALKDLNTALELNPLSATAWLYLAQTQLAMGENTAALESALHANQLDITIVPVYLTLAQAYIATGQATQAVAALQTYTIYEPNDEAAFLSIGTAYNAAGNFESALEALNRCLDVDGRNSEAFYQRGLAYLNLNDPSLAEDDFKNAIAYDPEDFDAQLGLAIAYFNQDLPGDAYVQAEQNAVPLAKSDKTKAQAYYWIALFLEKIGNTQSEEGARNYWNKLIALPSEVMPQEWRESAFEHLGITPTYTPTPRPTNTPIP